MRFIALVVTEGEMPAEAIAEMNRDWPAYAQEVERRGGMRLGRELDLPESGVTTIRVRGAEKLVTDGPFLETKEFIAGLGLFESADMDEAFEMESRNPVARFNPFEIRPLPETFRFGPGVQAFADMNDNEGIPYLLTVWVDGASADPGVGTPLNEACEAWRLSREEDGAFVLGGELGAPETAITLRSRNGQIERSDGPFLHVPEFVSAIEVIRACDFGQAVDIARGRPLAPNQAVEVRSFYSEGRTS